MKVRNVTLYTFTAIAMILAAGSVFCGCKDPHNGDLPPSRKEDTTSIHSVLVFLEGQVRSVKANTGHLLLSNIHNGKETSVPFHADSLTPMMASFLSTGSDDPPATELYARSSFPDSTHHRMVISYQARNDSTALDRVDIYTDPGTGEIRQLYLQYTRRGGDSLIRQQLIWKTDRSFTLIRTIEKHDFTIDIREQKVIWDQRP